MRIHLDLPRDRFISTPSTSSSSTAPTLSGPFIRLGLKRPHAVTPGGAQEEEEEEEEVVMIELQGELDFEGGNEGGPGGKVIGLLGLERMDKPTLHLGHHHLLHGKFVNLPKPLAVIRRRRVRGDERGVGVGDREGGSSRKRMRMAEGSEDDDDDGGDDDDGDTEDDEDDDGEEDEDEANSQDEGTERDEEDSSHLSVGQDRTKSSTSEPTSSSSASAPSSTSATASALPLHLQKHLTTPSKLHRATGDPIHDPPDKGKRKPESMFLPSSSPPPVRGPSVQERDYSSDLSSPITPRVLPRSRSDNQHLNPSHRQTPEEVVFTSKKKQMGNNKDVSRSRSSKSRTRTRTRTRTREYEVVDVIRKKIVFSLRPEPIVTATELPE